MKNLTRDHRFLVKRWEAGETIDVRHLDPAPFQLMPVECHIKMDGGKNGPSIAFVGTAGIMGMPDVFMQVSVEMFAPVLDELIRIKEQKQ